MAASLYVSDRGIVVDGLGEGAVDDAQFLRHGCGMRKQLAHPDALVIVVVFGELVLAGSKW